MKILLVNKFLYLKGGSERYLFTISEAFKKMGHEVIYFSMKDEKNVPCNTSKFFVSKKTTNGPVKERINMILHMIYSKEAYKKMTLLLKEENPDLVILNLVHKQITCSIIDAIKDYNPNIKIIWTMHDLICVCPSYTMLDGNGNICEKCLDRNFNHCKENKCIHGSTLMSFLSTYEAKQIKRHDWYNKVDLFVCPSEFYRKKLEEGHFTKSPIITLRNPLPLDTKYELNDKDKGYILYFGRLSYEKGIKTLIDCFKDFHYKLIVLGTGPIEKELKKYVSDKNIRNVELLGFKSGEELTNYIRNSRCVVLPSEWYENGPYSAMEAMALGKPLIVSNLGGLPELVENGKNGYIFDSKELLKESINKIITLSGDEYKNMAADSLNKAKKLFEPNNYIKLLMEQIDSLSVSKKEVKK